MTFLSVRVSRERRQQHQTEVLGTIFFAKRKINRVTLGKHKGLSGIVEHPPLLYLNNDISCFSCLHKCSKDDSSAGTGRI